VIVYLYFSAAQSLSYFSGNFGFGIDEHIDLGLKYDPAVGMSPCFGLVLADSALVGIYGMDIYCVLDRPGFRVNKKKRSMARIGNKHKITKDEAQKWCVQLIPAL
jgi:large subunit ribosomal protein L11e